MFDIAYEAGVRAVTPASEDIRAGVSDSTLMLKAVWPGQGPRPALGGVVNVRLPTGNADRGLGAPGTDVLIRGTIGQTFGSVTLFTNVSYTFVTEDRCLDTWFVGAAATGSATERLLVMGEVVSMVGANRADDEVLARLGLAYAFTERVRGDIGVGVALSRPAPDVALSVGVTFVLR
jgi:hypothetical protein